MNDENTTPKKIYIRKQKLNEKCRLCNKSTDNNYLLKIFSKSGREKDLARKVDRTCGVIIQETDDLPKTICRNCDIFINKMWTYRQMCQNTQIEIRQSYSIKRMLTLSPSTVPHPPKTTSNTPESRKLLKFNILPTKETRYQNKTVTS